jgi:signal transduction histidine kinase
MTSGREDQPPERDSTDRSLADEREKTDDELLKRGAALEESSDEVVASARDRAARILGNARKSADEKLGMTTSSRAQQATLKEERASEDRALRDERATADQKLANERDTRGRALAALLALERDETDDHLLHERKRADAAINSRDEFLAMVTHDLRNLLSGLVMSASSLMQVPCDDVTVKAAIRREGQRIHRHAAGMNRLVGDLLDVVSIEAGRLAVIPETEDARELLREIVDAFQTNASAKKISLRTEVKSGTLLARYDRERILQVLANLVGNAVKFTPEGGRIDLFAEADADQIRFGVRDTGPGIPSDRLLTVFDRYWQHAKDRHGGLGLGLYIARCIVDAHGGKIWAESLPGEGSTFYFTLPAASSPAAPATARS